MDEEVGGWGCLRTEGMMQGGDFMGIVLVPVVGDWARACTGEFVLGLWGLLMGVIGFISTTPLFCSAAISSPVT